MNILIYLNCGIKQEINEAKIIPVKYVPYAVAKTRPEKISDLIAGIRFHSRFFKILSTARDTGEAH